jgi:hypothetical protein
VIGGLVAMIGGAQRITTVVVTIVVWALTHAVPQSHNAKVDGCPSVETIGQYGRLAVTVAGPSSPGSRLPPRNQANRALAGDYREYVPRHWRLSAHCRPPSHSGSVASDCQMRVGTRGTPVNSATTSTIARSSARRGSITGSLLRGVREGALPNRAMQHERVGWHPARRRRRQDL